ncbi:MAG TPA: SHOCT domain-containing protein, partial [Actinomycetes bacterium]
AYAPPPQAAAAPADDSADRLEQLKQLGELKAQGVLTEAEFQAEKNKILNA